jgi:hypothetical protein
MPRDHFPRRCRARPLTIATGITNRWLLHASVLHQSRPVPSAPLNWTTTALSIGVGILGALAEIMLFGRRDLACA